MFRRGEMCFLNIMIRRECAMKKQYILLGFVIITVSIGAVFQAQVCPKKVLTPFIGIEKQLNTKTANALKRLTEEEEEKRKQLDATISRLLTQIDKNMSEEYWLWGTQEKTEGVTALDIYVNDIENLEHIVLIPSEKVAFLNGKGDEISFFYIMEYGVLDGSIEGLTERNGRYVDSRDEIKTALEKIEKIIGKKLNYVKTIEEYEWPQAKQPEYKVEDLQSTYIYQNFDLCMERQLNFSEDSEVYLGLWNGYSNSVRMMYKVLEQDGENHYYSTEMNLDGQRCNFINEVSEERYERFQLIAVQMM